MLTLRPATPSDVPHILAFIRELAAYEREPDAVLATEADLLRDGFPADESKAPRRFHSLIAEWNGQPAGFALYFYSYSTWEGRAGIYLEDLFVRPEFRGKGIGKALLTKGRRHRRRRRLRPLRVERPRLEPALHRLLPPDGCGHEV